MVDYEVTAKLNVDCTGLEEATNKLERFKQLIEEANSLADELAEKNITIRIDVKSQA